MAVSYEEHFSELPVRRVRGPESPIEWKMYDALRIVASYEYGFDVLGQNRGFGEPITIEPQVQIGSRRVDLVVSPHSGTRVSALSSNVMGMSGTQRSLNAQVTTNATFFCSVGAI
jgi:hypothetical protein